MKGQSLPQNCYFPIKLFIVLLVVFASFIYIPYYLWYSGYFANECVYEHGYLIHQTIINNSLWIEFRSEKCMDIGCGYCYRILKEIHKGEPFNKNYIYYFEGQNRLLPYKQGEKITIRWCYVPAIDDWRIRGVFEGWKYDI